MHIAILECAPDQKSATGARGRAMKHFLAQAGHTVDVLSPQPEQVRKFQRSRFDLWPRVKRRILRRKTLPHVWDFLADQLEPQLRRGGYDVVIGRGQDVAYVLTRPLECLKVLDMANVLFLESYYTWGPNLNEVEETFQKEMQVFEQVDYILSPHNVFSEYFLRQFDQSGGLARKVVTVRLGCPTSTRFARYAHSPRLVYAGSYYYIQDPYLLAFLTKTSPYAIDCYGPTDPNRAFLPARLNYKGYAPTTDFLADYQFGLITVSRDILRQHAPSTKFAYYFAYGLPVLFPAWMKEGYTYPDCAIPYVEENFVDQVQAAAEPARWEQMRGAARELAGELTWENVLRPLGDLIGAGGQKCR